MENIKNKTHAYSAAINLVESTLGKEIFKPLNLSAKEIILDTLQQELQKFDNKKLLQTYRTRSLPQLKPGNDLSDETRA